jgi:hypothetical protein
MPVFVAAVLLPRTSLAQSVAGQVTDETGAVLPGVTVEAASDALIGGTRTAVSDGSGRYEVTALQPGTYRVTFKLQGFRTVVRENIRVTSDVAIAVSVRLAVGQVEETVTVTGASPVVDVLQSTKREVLDREILDELPTSRTTHSAGAVIPGLKMTGAMVGGQGNTTAQQYLVTRGKTTAQNNAYVDGLNTAFGTSGAQAYDNYGAVQDVTIETNTISPEVHGSGVRINMIPRDGGNTFSGDVTLTGLRGGWQANNLTSDEVNGVKTPFSSSSTLTQTPVKTPSGTPYAYDLNPSEGGPILKNKLWFFISGRLNRAQIAPTGVTIFAPNPVTGILGPGPQKGIDDTATDNFSFRLTWQVNEKSKIALYRDQFWRYDGHLGASSTSDFATVPTIYPRATQYIFPVKWTMTATNRLLLEAGLQHFGYNQPVNVPEPGVAQTPGTAAWYASASRFDTATGYTTVGPSSARFGNIQPKWYYAGSVSYVTGSHSFKSGIQYWWQRTDLAFDTVSASLQQRYTNGVPNAVMVFPTPAETISTTGDLDGFVQDRWTIRRFTANIGLRIEHETASQNAVSAPAGRFTPARSVPAANLYNYTDPAPRMSVAYDVFGTGKTAVKASAGKFLDSTPSPGGFTSISSAGELRNWFDCALIPGTSRCDPTQAKSPTNNDGIAEDNEIPASTNPNFGYVTSLATPGTLKRSGSWDYSVSVQQELRPGVALTLVWYYSREGNISATEPVGVTPDSYVPFTLPNPLNPSDVISVFNLKPGTSTALSQTRLTSNYRVYDGYEVSVVARLPSGGRIMGGWFFDRKNSNTCDTTNPNNFRFCDTTGATYQQYGQVPTLPFLHEFKLSVAHPLPWSFQGSLSFVSVPGNGIGNGSSISLDPNTRWQQVSYAVPASLFPGGPTVPVSVPLLYPNQLRLGRWNELDVKVSRTFSMGHVKVNPQIEVFNLNDSSVVTGASLSYSSALGLLSTPTGVLTGRTMRLGALVKF